MVYFFREIVQVVLAKIQPKFNQNFDKIQIFGGFCWSQSNGAAVYVNKIFGLIYQPLMQLYIFLWESNGESFYLTSIHIPIHTLCRTRFLLLYRKDTRKTTSWLRVMDHVAVVWIWRLEAIFEGAAASKFNQRDHGQLARGPSYPDQYLL